MALVARKTWMRGRAASFKARHAVSMSSRLQRARPAMIGPRTSRADRKSTRLNSSHLVISYAVFCLKKKNTITYFFILTQHPRMPDNPDYAIVLVSFTCTSITFLCLVAWHPIIHVPIGFQTHE